MKINHNVLGECEFLTHFEGKKNQLVLVQTEKTEHKHQICGIPPSMKPRHWLLWGPLDMKIEDLGKTCLIQKNGYTYSQSKAIQTFMRTSQYVDELTMNKKHA